MSDCRVGIISEGPTDTCMIEAVLRAVFPEEHFICDSIFPSAQELSMQQSSVGFGWGGVCRVCGELETRLEFATSVGSFDFLVIHIDGDVAHHTYQSAGIRDHIQDLPCGEAGEPITTICEKLEQVVRRWIGDAQNMPHIVFCIPYIATETWAGAIFFPEAWEDIAEETPEKAIYSRLERLGNTKREKKRRLMHNGKKITGTYRRMSLYLTHDVWESVTSRYEQAKKFDKGLKGSRPT